MTLKNRAEWLLFGATFLWGGTFVVIKWGLMDLSPLLLIAIRFSLAAFLFFVIFRQGILEIRLPGFLKGVLLGLMLFAGYATQTAGLQYTTASKSAFITGLMVIFTPLFQVIIEKRRPHRRNLVGIAVVSVGLWLLTNPSGGGFNIGDGLTLACAVIFGLYIVCMDIFSKEADVYHLTFSQLLACAALGWVCVAVLEEPYLRATWRAVWALGYLAILGTIVTTYIQTGFQKFTTPTRAAIIFTVEPVWAALTGHWFLLERLGWAGILGGGFIITGVLISESRRSNSEPVPPLGRG